MVSIPSVGSAPSAAVSHLTTTFSRYLNEAFYVTHHPHPTFNASGATLPVFNSLPFYLGYFVRNAHSWLAFVGSQASAGSLVQRDTHGGSSALGALRGQIWIEVLKLF